MRISDWSSDVCSSDLAMIGATLTTRLAQNNITKSTITAFSLAFLVYNLKPLWAWVVAGVRLPVLGRLGHWVSWLIFAGLLVMAAVVNLALADPPANIAWVEIGRAQVMERVCQYVEIPVGHV